MVEEKATEKPSATRLPHFAIAATRLAGWLHGCCLSKASLDDGRAHEHATTTFEGLALSQWCITPSFISHTLWSASIHIMQTRYVYLVPSHPLYTLLLLHQECFSSHTLWHHYQVGRGCDSEGNFQESHPWPSENIDSLPSFATSKTFGTALQMAAPNHCSPAFPQVHMRKRQVENDEMLRVTSCRSSTPFLIFHISVVQTGTITSSWTLPFNLK